MYFDAEISANHHDASTRTPSDPSSQATNARPAMLESRPTVCRCIFHAVRCGSGIGLPHSNSLHSYARPGKLPLCKGLPDAPILAASIRSAHAAQRQLSTMIDRSVSYSLIVEAISIKLIKPCIAWSRSFSQLLYVAIQFRCQTIHRLQRCVLKYCARHASIIVSDMIAMRISNENLPR